MAREIKIVQKQNGYDVRNLPDALGRDEIVIAARWQDVTGVHNMYVDDDARIILQSESGAPIGDLFSSMTSLRNFIFLEWGEEIAGKAVGDRAGRLRKTILNYSHPLSDRAKMQLIERFGEIQEIVIPVQIDFSKEIYSQLNDLIIEGLTVCSGDNENYHDFWPDFVIPPALSFAAARVGAYWLDGDEGRRSTMIVLKASEGVLRQYEVADFVPPL